MEGAEVVTRKSQDSTVSEEQVVDHRKIRSERRQSLDKGKAKAEEGLAKQGKETVAKTETPTPIAGQQQLEDSTVDTKGPMPGGFPGDELADSQAHTTNADSTVTTTSTTFEQDDSITASQQSASLSFKADQTQHVAHSGKATSGNKPRPSLLDEEDPVPLVSISAQPETASAIETVDWQKAPLDFNESELDASVAVGLNTTAIVDGNQEQAASLIDFDEPSTELDHIPVLSLMDQGSWASMTSTQPPNSHMAAAPTASNTGAANKDVTSPSFGASDKKSVDPMAFNEKVWDNFDDRNTFFDFSVKPEYDASEEEGEEQEAAEVEMFAEVQPRAQSIHLHKPFSAHQSGDQFIGRFAPAVRSQPKDMRKTSIVTVEPKDTECLFADRSLDLFSQSRRNPLATSNSTDKQHPEPVPLYPSFEAATSGQHDQASAKTEVEEDRKAAQNAAVEDEFDAVEVQRTKATAADSDTECSSKSANKTSSAIASSDRESNVDPFGLNTPEAIAQREQWKRDSLAQKANYSFSTSQDDVTSASPAGYTDTDGAYVSTGYDTDLRKPFSATQRRKDQEELPQPRSPTAHVRHPWDDLPPIVSITDNLSHLGQEHPDSSDFLPPAFLGASTTSPSAGTSQEPARTKLYPPAPLEPWGPPHPVHEPAELRHRSTLGRSSTSVGPISSDPPLTFLGSTRSPSARPPTSNASSALLGDLPTAMLGEKVGPGAAGTQSTKAPQKTTLPANPKDAPVLRGRYELPSMKEVQSWNAAHSLGPYALRRLVFNVGGLMFTSWVWRRAAVRTLAQKLASSFGYDPLYWIDWVLVAIFWVNIIDALWRYSKAANKFEKLPLTPEQRLRLGLEPVESSVPGAVPVFQKSTSSTMDLLEVPLRSTYVAPSTQRSASGKLHSQLGKSLTANASASVIWSKSMSKSLQQQSQVHTKSELESLIKTVESREGAGNEWRMAEAAAAEASKRASTFALGVSDRLGAPSHFGAGATGTGPEATGRKPDPSLGLSVSRYQPALRTALSKDRISKTELQKDGLPVWTPAKVLKTLKVTEAQLDQWVLRMRKWLWAKVVSPMCDEMEAVDKAFEAAGFGYLDCKSATMFSTSAVVPQKNPNGLSTASVAGGTAGAGAAGPANAAGSGASPANPLGWGAATTAVPQLPSAFAAPAQPALPSTPTSLKDLNDRWGNDEMVKRRMVLEAYLAVPGVSNRKYVVERIKAFGPLLSQFKWDSEGVRWDNGRKSWTADLPTDSHILMHLFATFLDLAMPAQPAQGYGRFPFSYKHIVSVDDKPDPNVAIQIKQSSRNPPCYHLVVNGNVWEIVPKRMNIWYTLVLFIYVVMKESGGYLGQAYFGSRALGLDNVVEE